MRIENILACPPLGSTQEENEREMFLISWWPWKGIYTSTPDAELRDQEADF